MKGPDGGPTMWGTTLGWSFLGWRVMGDIASKLGKGDPKQEAFYFPRVDDR